MYLNPTDKYWAIDCEGDLIPSTKLFCMCAVNIVTRDEVFLVGHEEISNWLTDKINEGCTFIAHNMIGYDGPTLNRLLGVGLTTNKIIDTFVLSSVFNPSLQGGHSLAAWGDRLKFPKGDFNDFTSFSQEMLEYCMQDTKLCRKIYLAIISRMKMIQFSETGLELEHKATQLVKKQQQDGFAFNIQEAHSLYATLREYENEIRDEIYKVWPPALEIVKVCKRPFKADGKPSANYQRHIAEYQKVVVSEDKKEYYCYDLVEFNIASPMQRVEKLLELGWEPKEFTKITPKGGGGNPQPTIKGELSPSLQAFVDTSGRKEPKLIAQWIEINSRANMINTWIEAYNYDTGCIHGSLWLANTLRYRHSNPNTANIPAVRVGEGQPILGRQGSYTYESRNLWTVRDRSSRNLVGVDAKGIQLRVLAHYLNNPNFTKAVLDGDPHSYNQEVGGFGTRAIAKTFIYAFLLGAGDAKVGQIIGGTTKDGREIKNRFIGNFPGLEQLLNDLERQIERTGRIRLCDGTPVIVSRSHTRLGFLLQGDESRIMKKAAVLVAAKVRRENLDVIKVGDIHDEWQSDVLLEHVERYIEICVESFKQAGEFFNYRLPIECDAKVGLTWAETH